MLRATLGHNWQQSYRLPAEHKEIEGEAWFDPYLLLAVHIDPISPKNSLNMTIENRVVKGSYEMPLAAELRGTSREQGDSRGGKV